MRRATTKTLDLYMAISVVFQLGGWRPRKEFPFVFTSFLHFPVTTRSPVFGFQSVISKIGTRLSSFVVVSRFLLSLPISSNIPSKPPDVRLHITGLFYELPQPLIWGRSALILSCPGTDVTRTTPAAAARWHCAIFCTKQMQKLSSGGNSWRYDNRKQNETKVAVTEPPSSPSSPSPSPSQALLSTRVRRPGSY